MMVKSFGQIVRCADRKIIKVSKYLIKSEAEIHGYTIKKLFWRVLKISQKKTYSVFSNKVVGLHSEIFLKKGPVHVFSCKLCQTF